MRAPHNDAQLASQPQQDETPPTGDGVGDGNDLSGLETRPLRSQPSFVEEMVSCLPPGYVYSPGERMICVEDGRRLDPFCGPIHVRRRLRDRRGENWQIEVEFEDRDGGLRNACVEEALLHNRPAAVLGRLVSQGFPIWCAAQALAALLLAWPDRARAFTTSVTGWFDHPEGGLDFVMPGGEIISGRKRMREQPVTAAGPVLRPVGKSGDLDGWRTEVASLARGNPALVFAIAAGLAGPLLQAARLDTAGFNFHGPSTLGKTVLLHLACSTLRAPDDLQRWSVSQPDGDSACAVSRDLLLAAEAFPSDPTARQLDRLHMIAVGGMGGADLPGGRHVLLSTSEAPVAAAFRRRRRDLPAEISTRLFDIPGDCGQFGLFEDLHGHASPGAFAQAIEAAIIRHHGHATPAFVEHVAHALPGNSGLEPVLTKFSGLIGPEIGMRVADLSSAQTQQLLRFSLIAAAGELAIGSGLLRWQKFEALRAVIQIARFWHQQADTLSPGLSAMTRVQRFIESNMERFAQMEPGRALPPCAPGQAGWCDDRYAYIHAQVFRNEIAAPDSPASLARELAAIGVLVPAGTEQRLLQRKLPQSWVGDRPRVYQIDIRAVQGR